MDPSDMSLYCTPVHGVRKRLTRVFSPCVGRPILAAAAILGGFACYVALKEGPALLFQALGQKDLEQRLIRNIALVGQDLQPGGVEKSCAATASALRTCAFLRIASR